MLPVGLLVSGYCLGTEQTKNGDGNPQTIVGVAVGISSYRVYMKAVERDRPFGDLVLIKCRAYAGKNGVVFVDGEFVEQE